MIRLAQMERKNQPRLGGRKLYHLMKPELQKAGVKVGRDGVFRILREEGMLLEPIPAVYPSTTQSYHTLPVFRNLIRDLEVTGPNQVWVSDLTYLRTKEGYMFLALITDKYSRKIVGWHVGDSLEAMGCVRALEMALKELPRGSKPIHHSDRGCQYCSHEYVGRLMKAGLRISMTEKDHCAENALAERMNGILKQEYGLGIQYATKQSAYAAVRQGIRMYNTVRPHTALAYEFPAVVHEKG